MQIPAGGRRLYVAEAALDRLCTDATTTQEISRTRAGIRVARIVGHHLALDDSFLTIVSPETATSVRERFVDGPRAHLSALLRRMTVDGNPLLGQEESVMATCWDAGYQTFATGQGAADVMFADNEPISDLISRIGGGEKPTDLADLIVIRPNEENLSLDGRPASATVGRDEHRAIRRQQDISYREVVAGLHSYADTELAEHPDHTAFMNAVSAVERVLRLSGAGSPRPQPTTGSAALAG